MFSEYSEIITIEELMELLMVGKNVAYSMLKSGEIKGFKIGKKWKIPKQSVEAYIKQRLSKG